MEFEIGCVSRENLLRLSHYHGDTSDPYGDAGFEAQLSAPGLSAHTMVPDLISTQWATFFTDLASSWRGWQGTKSIRSVEGHLVLEASADPTGHISLRVTLATEPLYNVWRATCTLRLEAGQLEGLAKRAVRFFDAAA